MFNERLKQIAHTILKESSSLGSSIESFDDSKNDSRSSSELDIQVSDNDSQKRDSVMDRELRHTALDDSKDDSRSYSELDIQVSDNDSQKRDSVMDRELRHTVFDKNRISRSRGYKTPPYLSPGICTRHLIHRPGYNRNPNEN